MRPSEPSRTFAFVVVLIGLLAGMSPPVGGAGPSDTEPLSLLLYPSGVTVGGSLPLVAFEDGVEFAGDVAQRVGVYTALTTTVIPVKSADALSPRTAPVLVLAQPPDGRDAGEWLDAYIAAGGFVVIAPEDETSAQAFRDWAQAAAPSRVFGEAPYTALARPEDRLPKAFRYVLAESGSIDAIRADGEVRVAAPRSVRASRGAGPAEHRVRTAAAVSLAAALRSPFARRLTENPIRIAARREDSRVVVDLTLGDMERPAAPRVTITDTEGNERDAELIPNAAATYVVDIATPPFDPARYWVKVRWEGDPPLSRVQRLSDVMGRVDTTIRGQNVWAAGSPAGVRVIVRDVATGEPIQGASIHAKVVADDDLLDEARVESDRAGSADIRFRLPSGTEGAVTLLVDVSSNVGDDSVRHEIDVVSARKTLLTTDKPTYQPGQRIHIRSLTLRAGDMKAVGGDRVTFEVEDAKGNKVFKRAVDRNGFGVASTQFDLAREVNMGAYTVRVVDSEWSQEKTVSVERYVLPKFRVTAEFDRSDYRPGDVVTGSIQADYLFGKPVAGSPVEIVASKFDVGWDQFSRIKGRTDDAGSYTFELDLPTYFAGLPLDAGDSFVRFEITVTDGADHPETVTASRPVARVPLQVVLIPETGELVPNVANELYAVVTTPKGEPVEAGVKVTLGDVTREAVSDAMGVARLVFTPTSDDATAHVSVTTANGDHLERQIALDLAGPSLLLRPSVALARVGDVVDATVHSPRASGWVYLDVIRSGQTVRTKSAAVTAHRAAMSFAVEAEDVGTLELHAYQPGADGEIRRDTRLVHVSPSDDLTIDVTPSATVYRPGEDARVRFHVSDRSGHPVLAALGVHVVDEAVFARQEMQPGLERVFFLLEEELMRPKVEIHGFDAETVVTPRPAPERAVSASRDQAARVLFAAADHVERRPSLSVDARATKDDAIRADLVKACYPLARRIAAGLTEYYAARDMPRWSHMEVVNVLGKEGVLTAGDLLDPWAGRAFAAPSAQVLSAGPDGALGTPDDVDITDAIFGHMAHFYAEGEWARADEDVASLAKGRRVRPGGGDVMAFGRVTAFDGALELPGVRQTGAEILELASAVPEPSGGGFADVAPTRVREFFPETLFVAPSVITDEEGDASLSFALADSITTWRLTSIASATDGRLGSVSAGIRVFQDFFIDLDLPVSLTVGDEVSVPVALYNYLDGPQTVRLEIEPEPWFELSGPPEIAADLAEGQVTSRYFRVKAVAPGRGTVTVRAFGSKMADAVRRSVEVLPDGRRVETTESGRVTSGEALQVGIPEDALPGSARMFVKLHPGVFSQIVEGLDSVLRMPAGCFEQTSSATYPNILALQYMNATGQNTPEVRMKAQQYIGLGYQRLLSFEVDGGGFEWFGNAPANTVLTAYGLLEFQDMSNVHEVDPAVIARTRQFLLRRQAPDGSWAPDPAFLHAESWGRIQGNELLPTAYVLWALAASGLNPDALASAVDYIRAHWDSTRDPYTLAIVANALTVAAPDARVTTEVLDRLAELATIDGDAAHWRTEIPTITHARGDGSTLETTAMAALALAASGQRAGLLDRALTYLVKARDPRGTWHSTQATILALKALLAGTAAATPVDATVTVSVDGVVAEEVTITPDTGDVTRIVDVGEVSRGGHEVAFQIEGQGRPLFQVVARHYAPWPLRDVPAGDATGGLDVRVTYDRTSMEKDDIVTARCYVANRGPSPAKMVVVDLGLPPGFAPVVSDFEALVSSGVIQKYEMTPRQVILYFDELAGPDELTLEYHLRAKYPIQAKTRPTKAYEYYNPRKMAVAPPVEILVAER